MTLVDILTAEGEPTGQTASVDEISKKGLWRRGVHALIYNPQQEVIIQKRSHEIIYHPDLLDLSVGGGVDAGETPLEAIIRETREELGLIIEPGMITPIGVRKYNHRWPIYKKTCRCFNHGYLIRVEATNDDLVTEPSELTWAKFIPLAEAKRLIKKGRLKSLGRLEPTYAYYKYQIEQLDKVLAS